MLCAVYARKSTEDQNSEEHRSAVRQVEHAKAFIEGRGWRWAPELIFSDDGVSGAEYLNRPGLCRLLAAKDSYDGLVMSEQSRFGRDMTRNAYYILELVEEGKRITYYLTGEEERADNATYKAMMSLRGMGAEMEREKCAQRTHDALRRRAERGFVVGGRVYGCNNRPVYAEGERDRSGNPRRLYTEYEVNQKEAAVVVLIFELYAQGWGISRIAKHLNAQGVPPPRRGTGSWCPTSIREMLRNEKYRGVFIWNRMKEGVFRGGTHGGYLPRPEEEWVRVDRPELRIVPEELWQRVQERVGEAASRHPSSGCPALERGRHLLSGLARCACGGSIVVRGGARGKDGRSWLLYGCSYHHKRGAAVCPNSLTARKEALERAVLRALERTLDPAVFVAAVERAVELVGERLAQASVHERELRRRIEEIQRKIDNLVAALEEGGGEGGPAAIREAIARREEEKRGLERERERLSALADWPRLSREELEAEIRRDLADFGELLRGDPERARLALQAVLDGPIHFVLAEKGGRRFYRFEGKLKPGEVLAGRLYNNGVPRGI